MEKVALDLGAIFPIIGLESANRRRNSKGVFRKKRLGVLDGAYKGGRKKFDQVLFALFAWNPSARREDLAHKFRKQGR